MGVQIAVDALALLAEAQVETEKLAREFLQSVTSGSLFPGDSIVRSVLSLLDELSMRGTVEGVEAQLAWLAESVRTFVFKAGLNFVSRRCFIRTLSCASGSGRVIVTFL